MSVQESLEDGMISHFLFLLFLSQNTILDADNSLKSFFNYIF